MGSHPLNFHLSEEHRMVVEAAQQLMERVAPRRNEFLHMIIEEQRYPDELWDQIAQTGFFGMLIPEEYGGTNLGLLAMTLAIEVFAGQGYSNTLAVLTTMDTMAILRGGTEEQKKRWLPQIADGSLKLAFAITEAESGTNSFKVRTTARREGDVYKLYGEKAWITGFDVADYCLVVARTIPYEEIQAQDLPRTYGMGLFLVDTKAPGITLYPMNTAGVEGFRQFRIHFDGAEVPVENRIGEEHEGAQVLFQALNPERITAAAQALGRSEFALQKAVEYASQRRVFGDTPIGSYQGVQHPLARIKVMQEAARMLTYRAAWSFDQQLPPREVGKYANMAKYLASEMAIDAIDRAIQTHGGNGFVKENHLINLWTAARLSRTAPVNNEMILNFVAEHVLGMPRSY